MKHLWKSVVIPAMLLAAFALSGGFPADAQTVSTWMWRNLASLAGSVGTATGTTEQTLATYSLPAKALVTAGQRVHATAVVSKAANTDSVTCKLYFGSETITTGANVTSGAGMTLTLDAVKTGASTQIVTGQAGVGTTWVAPVTTTGAETDTAAIVIKATCTDGTSAANDAVLQDFKVDMTM